MNIMSVKAFSYGSYYPLADRRGRGLAVAMLLVVGGSCLQAIPSVWKSPELVRISAITADNEIRSLSIGNYGELTGLALVLPFFLTLALQSKRYVRVTGIISCLATMALLMIATFSGLILLTSMAVCGCILFYLVIGGIRLNRFIWAVAAILAVGVAAAYILPSIYRRPEIGRFYDKLANTSSSVASVVAGQATDPTQRYTLMLDSLYVFLENPITGVALGAPGVESSGAGGHSSWMDALAMYGVLGGVPYLLFHLLVFYRLWQAWRCEHHNALHWGCLLSCGFYIFYSFFNVTTQGTTVALFLYVVAAGGQRTRVPSRFRNLILTNSTGNR